MTGVKCAICKVVAVLAGIGALNWGLVGLFQFDLVGAVLGEMSAASRAVYALVGIAGVLLLVSLVKCCPACSKGGSCQTKSGS